MISIAKISNNYFIFIECAMLYQFLWALSVSELLRILKINILMGLEIPGGREGPHKLSHDGDSEGMAASKPKSLL